MSPGGHKDMTFRAARPSGDVFAQTVLVHLDAAYNLARWLTRNDQDAEDIVQEACLRAYRFQDGFHGGNARAWLLTIVRNTFYSFAERTRAYAQDVEFTDDTVAAPDVEMSTAVDSAEHLLEQADTRRLVHRALERLPAHFREVIVLRELEDMSYREIAIVTGSPIGTVMSRLARARKWMLQVISDMDEAS